MRHLIGFVLFAVGFRSQISGGHGVHGRERGEFLAMDRWPRVQSWRPLAVAALLRARGLRRCEELIASVAPGTFAANGVALGNAITSVNGNFQYSNTFQVVSGAIAPAPIDVGNASTPVFLILYGTGIRNHVNPVTVTFATATPQTLMGKVRIPFKY